MNLKTWLAGLAGAMTLGLVAVSAEAAPVGGVKDLKGTAAQTSDVQPATGWYHRRYRYRPYYFYGPRYRYRYRYYRPGFRFYYGPPRRYYRRHWRYRYW
jgi:hypothetical protein